ncbi:MAG: eukaryotic-like serine/threonine-protein kinase [Actinomycetota bacterium]|nr:eukaryotic-like serine/threonine-protein kinase [Actinomycetota bacterium]
MHPQLIAGRYQVLRAIGRGGMGTVWLCRDEVLGREVAVKQIGALPGESATETKRAMREARSAAALNHPNAVSVFDVVDHDGRPWLVMEYVEGQTLADEISREGQLSPQRVADIGAQLAGALARAHERRIVHRDIKPGNVLIDKAGRPKISDFGIARGHGDEQLTQIGFITGTPGFLSPELARGGDPHSASDVWALGATLYAAVEGKSPYETRSNPIALLRAIATERPRPMVQAGALGPAINAMMHEDPACRWDMATSARRLGGIARITMVMPRVDPASTAVILVPPQEPTPTPSPTPTPAPALHPTQGFSPTQGLESAKGLESTQGLESTEGLESTRGFEAAPDTAAHAAATRADEARAAQMRADEARAAQVRAAESRAAAVRAAELRATEKRAAEVRADVLRAAEVRAEVRREADVRAAQVALADAPEAAPDEQGDPGETRGVVSTPAMPLRDRRGTRRWLPPVSVAVLLVSLGVGYLVNQVGDQGNVPSRPTAGSSPTQSTAPEASEAPAATTAPTRAAVPLPKPAPSETAVGRNKKLANFVATYYSDVTQDTGRTWNQLAPSMQDAAGGRRVYNGFWRTIKRVRVNQTVANASAKTAVVNLTFTSKNGASSNETHRFTFVPAGTSYRIASERR